MLYPSLPPEAEKEMVPELPSRQFSRLLNKVSVPQQRGTLLCRAGLFNRMQTLAQPRAEEAGKGVQR